MKKPFVFGVAVEEENFVGRSEEITVLSNNFKHYCPLKIFSISNNYTL